MDVYVTMFSLLLCSDWLIQHDTTVAAMQSALGVFDKTQPGYASAFVVELYSDPSKWVLDLVWLH